MATTADWNPLKELLTVQRRMNDLFESALARTNFEAGDSIDAWTPVADVMELDDALVLDLELPGMTQEQIELKIEGDELIVSGERSMDRDQIGEQYHRIERAYGNFSRRFRLPSTVERGGVNASYKDGLLRILLPNKREEQSLPIHVDID